MRAMKDSGIEWIGEIPQEWNTCRIKMLFEIIGGNGFKEHLQGNESGDYPFYKVSDINGCSIHSGRAANYISSQIAKEYAFNLVPSNSIIMSKIGEALKKNHRKISSTDCFIDNNLQALVPIDDIDEVFYFYVLCCINMEWFDNGGTIPSVNNQKLQDFKIPLTTKDQQISIGHWIFQKCAEIDALIAAKEKTNALLKERRQSIIYEAVTKGLDPTAPMKDSGVEWIGEIPEGWDVIRAKYITSISNGSDPKEEGDIPVYGSGSESFRTCGEYKEGPAVLIGRKGATLHIPHYVEGKYWNVDTAFDVKTDESKYLLKYYYYASICFDYRLYISTTTLPSMTQTNYGNMFLPLPSLEVQQEIIDHIEEALRTIDSLIAINDTAVQKLKEYRQSLIYEAVTGKVEV